MKRISFTLSLLMLAAASFAQDLKLPALSPGARISQDFSTSTIDIAYSRPSIRDRKVFGDVVAFGQLWRTGANAATKIKFGEDVNVGGQDIKAGEYALYSIPGENEWEIILNKGVNNSGTNGYTTSDDVARFKIKPRATEKLVNTFTINIGNITLNSCNIELSWENTKVLIPVKAKNEERLNASIEKAINNPNIPYFQAASYYYETNTNLDKAYQYVTKATDANPKAFYMWHLKAKIAAKQGKKEEARIAAEKSIETAKGTANEAEYKHNNEKIIKSLSKK